jgi:hypothetical protein
MAHHTVLPRMLRAERPALWAALIPLLTVLIQAGGYWLPARGWVLRARMLPRLSKVFHVLRVVDLPVLVAGVAGLARWFSERTGAAVLVVAIRLCGLLEYVNYFVTRLSCPASRWSVEVARWAPHVWFRT